jgi:hypothetical protein
MTSCVHKMCEWSYGQINMKRAILCTQLVICLLSHFFIFGILVGHDLSMHILCRFHRWLIFVRVIALFMFIWPYVHSHILCTQLVICFLSHFIHILYLTSCVHKMCGRTYGETNVKRAITLATINHPWNRYDMRMLRSWSTKIPNMNKMRQ